MNAKILIVCLLAMAILLSGCPSDGNPQVTPPNNGGTTPPTNGGTAPPADGGTQPTAELCHNSEYSTRVAKSLTIWTKELIVLDNASLEKLLDKINNGDTSAFEGISDLTCLTYLEVRLLLGQTYDLDYQPLESLTNLKYLYFASHNGIGSADLAFLSKLKNLERLDITYSGITDISPFSALSGNSKLTEMSLQGNKILDSDCEKLKSELPNVTISCVLQQ
ncbi:MAG: leucine-rich repeat domain-containing protein [Candidatus Diapherotrites archaeon]